MQRSRGEGRRPEQRLAGRRTAGTRFQANSTVLLLAPLLALSMSAAGPPIPAPPEAGQTSFQVGNGDAPLSARLSRVLDHPSLRDARVGVLVRDLDSDEPLAAHDADGLFSPASVTKVFTAATALWRLGPAFAWETPVAYRGERRGPTLEGDLWVLGRGAPDIVEEQLWIAARAIHEGGLRTVTGDLIVDDRFFDAERYGEGWPGGLQTQEAYHAPISALMANYAARRVGDEWRAVADPALHLGERFRELLKMAGVEMRGTVRRPSTPELAAYPALAETRPDEARAGLPPGLGLLHTVRSEPLARVVMDLNKFSNNVMAEVVLKGLGALEYGPPGTWTKGLAVVAQFLNQELGVPLGAYVHADGSGLSHRNRFSPRHVVDLLTYAWRDFHLGPELVASLKLSGLDGWNPRAFRDPPLRGELRLKSGHIRGVNTLTGYAHTNSGRTVVFCVMINEHRSQQWEIDQRMAEISRAILSAY